MTSTLQSIVEFHGSHSGHKCGYCKSPDTNFSDGMWAHALTVSDYQDLIDRGWRRSGQYCYKPTMDILCCPMYTIRCSVKEFKPTKSQKKVLKRVNRYLSGNDSASQAGDTRKMSTCSSEADIVLECPDRGEHFVESDKTPQDINICDIKTSLDEQQILGDDEGDATAACVQNEKNTSIPEITPPKDAKKGAGADPEKAPCKKAKQQRRERKQEKLKEKGIDVGSLGKNNKNKEKQLEEFLNELPEGFKNKLEVKLVRTKQTNIEWLSTVKETYELYVKYQTVVHDDKPEKFSQFKNFLVQTPLLEEYSETGPQCGYGSFHQQYWLEGKIIAVGVIDILPKCVSSVYFFYDPQFMNLTLGTYGALREIEFTRHLLSIVPELKYYYMGYYIHSCPKMRYKGNFYPSYLLCPETYNWFPIKDCIPKLEATKYARLNEDLNAIDSNRPTRSDIEYIPMWVNRVVMHYKMYKRKFANKVVDDVEELMKYAQLVGRKCSKSLILVK